MVESTAVHFTAPDGSFWSVHEISGDGDERGRSLIFVSDNGFRRVRTYPPGWRALAPEALWALSWTT